MDAEAATQIGPHLLAGESILWSGRPNETRSIAIRIAIIVILGAIVLAMRMFAPDSNLGAAMNQSAILLAAIVILLIVEGALFHSHVTSTFYALTNQRIIILTGLRAPEPAGVPIARLNGPQIKVRRHLATITIYASVIETVAGAIDPVRAYIPFTNPSLPPIWGGRGECYKLVGLEDAAQVYELIADAAKKLNEPDLR